MICIKDIKKKKKVPDSKSPNLFYNTFIKLSFLPYLNIPSWQYADHCVTKSHTMNESI